MNEIPLSEYVEKHGQTQTAIGLGVSQGAVWQMLQNERCIFVVESESGHISAYERKPIGKQRPAA